MRKGTPDFYVSESKSQGVTVLNTERRLPRANPFCYTTGEVPHTRDFAGGAGRFAVGCHQSCHLRSIRCAPPGGIRACTFVNKSMRTDLGRSLIHMHTKGRATRQRSANVVSLASIKGFWVRDIKRVLPTGRKYVSKCSPAFLRHRESYFSRLAE